MPSQKILIVEDEIKIARFVELELKYEGYVVEIVHDGRSGLEVLLLILLSAVGIFIIIILIIGSSASKRMLRPVDTA